MKTLLVLAVVALGASACASDPTPADSSAVAPSAGPTSTEVASRRVPETTQGLALHGAHVAFAQDERRLVWEDWRTGERRTVYRSAYGSLHLLAVSGRWAEALDQRPEGAGGDDPRSPRRYVRLDLARGTTRPVPPPPATEIPGVPAGLVVQASRAGHRVVWTQRPAHGPVDGHTVLTEDLRHPDRAPVVLARSPTQAVSSPVVGSGFVGWVQDGRLQVASSAGGPATSVGDPLAPAAVPAASRHLVALVARDQGVDRLTVLRIGCAPDVSPARPRPPCGPPPAPRRGARGP